VLFIDASQYFEQGKNQNMLREEDIQKIVETHQQFEDGKLNPGVVEDKFSYVATFEEIKENEFNLNIPRYVDTFEEEEEVDLQAVQERITELETELVEVQGQMADYLKELGL